MDNLYVSPGKLVNVHHADEVQETILEVVHLYRIDRTPVVQIIIDVSTATMH